VLRWLDSDSKQYTLLASECSGYCVHIFTRVKMGPQKGAEEELEIELNEDEPGQMRYSIDVSPVKIVKNPDGSLQRAAMMQSMSGFTFLFMLSLNFSLFKLDFEIFNIILSLSNLFA
jgi:hypothetical protein